MHKHSILKYHLILLSACGILTMSKVDAQILSNHNYSSVSDNSHDDTSSESGSPLIQVEDSKIGKRPYSSTALLLSGYSAENSHSKYITSGSGTWIASNMILTCAHMSADHDTGKNELVGSNKYLEIGTPGFNKLVGGLQNYLRFDELTKLIKLSDTKFYDKDMYLSSPPGVAGELCILIYPDNVELVNDSVRIANITDNPRNLTGETITMVGYPGKEELFGGMFQTTAKVVNDYQIDLTDYQHSKNTFSRAEARYDSFGGNSGSGIYDKSGKLVGVHFAGANDDELKSDSDNSSAVNYFASLHKEQVDWINKMIDKYGNKGWYSRHGHKYYSERGRLLRNTKKKIDGKYYHFDAKGVANEIKTHTASKINSKYPS